MTSENIGWWVMAASATFCAVRMITAKNPVHAALWLVGNFVSLGVIFLILSAPMLFAVQLIVYAGAIMVLFLFVIMFFMSPKARQFMRPPLRLQQMVGGVLSIALLSLICYSFYRSADLGVPIMDGGGSYDPDSIYASAQAEEASHMGSSKDLSIWMFQYQMLPFELTGVLLLVALLGAMMVARDEVGEGRRRIEHYAAVIHPLEDIPVDEASGALEAEPEVEALA